MESELVKFCKDGSEISYCFVQIKEKLFPLVPKSTVKGWLRELKIKCRNCSEDERAFFKESIPTLCGAFGAISAADLQRLLEFSKYKKIIMTSLYSPSTTEPTLSDTTPASTPSTVGTSAENSDTITTVMPPSTVYRTSSTPTISPSVSFVTTTTATPSVPTAPTSGNSSREMQVTPSVNNVTGINLQSVNNTMVNLEDRELIAVDSNDVVAVDDGSSDVAAQLFTDKFTPHDREVGNASKQQISSGTDTQALVITTPDINTKLEHSLSDDTTSISDTPPPATNLGGNPRIRYSLHKDKMSPELIEEFKKLNLYYSADINPSRDCCKFNASTMGKLKERLLCFLGFVQRSNTMETLSLKLTCSCELVEQFVQYLTKSRKLMASTVARSLSAIVNAIKFVRQDVAEIENLPTVKAIRNMQRQLSREESVTRKRKREGFASAQGEQFLFSHILDVLRQLREQYYNATGIACSRHLHDFTMLSLYIRALPGRCKEIRTLQLLDNSESEKSFCTENVDGLNALVLEPAGGIVLIESDFKTVKQAGPSKIDLSDDHWLVYFIKTYLEKHREVLLLGKQHNYVFFNRNGDPFLGSGSLSKYLGDLFERETRIRASTTKMRHAIVTYFMSLPESQNLKLRESLASLLKHSVRHQQQTYNDQRRQERVGLGRTFMRKSVTDLDPFEEEHGEMSNIESFSKQNLESLDESDGDELTPQIGEIVGLLDPASKGPDEAYIFVAKILRYTPDKEKVCLQEMEELPDSKDLYRVKCSSTWWESVRCISYPIDIVYNSSEKAYQLRTSPRQIYNDIMSST